MINIEKTKVAYIFDGLTSNILPDEAVKAINAFMVTENLYLAATREITTKLENLNDEFKYVKDRNPIHQIKARVKTPKSIFDKLTRRGLELSVESARKKPYRHCRSSGYLFVYRRYLPDFGTTYLTR